MEEYQALLSVFVGFLCIYALMTIIKTIRSYYVFKASFYTEIYSGFLEFLFRQKNLKRMSTSYWLENELGHHRIMFQITKTSQKDILQPYILILLSSGLYVIQLYNETARYIIKDHQIKSIGNENKTHILPDPIDNFKNFQKHFQDLIGDTTFPMIFIAAFTDKSQLDIQCQKFPIVLKKDLISTIKTKHEHTQLQLDDEDIERIYHLFIKKTQGNKNR